MSSPVPFSDAHTRQYQARSVDDTELQEQDVYPLLQLSCPDPWLKFVSLRSLILQVVGVG